MSKEKKGWGNLPLSKLVQADWNYKTNNEALTQKLLKNIERNGQVENLLVRPIAGGKYEVVNGNHRLEVFRQLEIKEVMCFNLGKVTDAAAKRIAIETNETRFDTDALKLAEIVRDLKATFDSMELVETLPFTEAELQAQERLLNWDWDAYNEKPGTLQEIPEGMMKASGIFANFGIKFIPERTAQDFLNLLAEVKKDLKLKEGEHHLVLDELVKRNRKQVKVSGKRTKK